MKKTIILTFLVSFWCLACVAQDFQFQMYFEDAVGNHDTLTIGYDINGNEQIDTMLGEENIFEEALDSVFDVRISNAFFNNGEATFHTKRQILPDSCGGWFFPVISIDIKCLHWPVTAKWDNTLFNTVCREGSVFTSVHPGGWWDVVGDPSNLGKVELSNSNTVTFTSNHKPTSDDVDYAYVNATNDTIPVFWMTFGPLELLTLDIEEVETEFHSFPNPVNDFYYFDIPKQLVKEVRIVDMLGNSKLLSLRNGSVDLRNFKSGHYIVVVHTQNGNSYKKKLIKN